MANLKYNFFLLTGDSGVGKTTLTKKIVSILESKHVKVSGFYTEELRNGRIREGFNVVTLDGKSGALARDSALLKQPVKYSVGKYGVLLEEFEDVAIPCIDQAKNSGGLIVIDEIGKMELFSKPFKDRIKDIFSQASNCIVLATVTLRTRETIIMNIKNSRKAKLWQVTKENRDNLHSEILKEMKTVFNFD